MVFYGGPLKHLPHHPKQNTLSMVQLQHT
jgi:hypothetical protein